MMMMNMVQRINKKKPPTPKGRRSCLQVEAVGLLGFDSPVIEHQLALQLFEVGRIGFQPLDQLEMFRVLCFQGDEAKFALGTVLALNKDIDEGAGLPVLVAGVVAFVALTVEHGRSPIEGGEIASTIPPHA